MSWEDNEPMGTLTAVACFQALSRHSPEGLRERTKTSVSVTSAPSEISTRRLPNTSQMCYICPWRLFCRRIRSAVEWHSNCV